MPITLMVSIVVISAFFLCRGNGWGMNTCRKGSHLEIHIIGKVVTKSSASNSFSGSSQSPLDRVTIGNHPESWYEDLV